jgi:uncharacterized membrane protein
MERLLFESAVRAILIAAGTAVVLSSVGIKNAAARHNAWTGVVVLMLLLPIWTGAGPKLSLEILRPAPAAADITALRDVNRVPGSVAIPGSNAEPAGRLPDTHGIPEPARHLDWKALLLGGYLLGVCALLARLALGTVRARRLIRSAVMQEGRLISGSCAAPITVGSLHPVVILPQTWQRWPKGQLDAVLTHEGEHARRYHPLVQWLALLNRAVFWFHPLAWWLERKLAALAEGACDSAVLAAGHAPQDYSEYLLDLARSTMREGRRVSVVGMAMPGRHLTHRIQQIFQGVPMQSISRTRVACTVVLCAISSVVFAAATLAPQQIHPVDSNDSKVALASSAVPAAAPQDPIPSAQRPTRSSLLNPPPAAASKAPTVARTQSAAVSQNPREQTSEEVKVPLLSVNVLPQQGVVPPDNDSFLTTRKVRLQHTLGAEIGWPNTWLLAGLGLTDEQKARIEKTLEAHRQNIDSTRERLDKEETQFAQLLAADPMDRGAILTQLDRVIQARGEMERTNAAMTLEMREYLTHAQWLKLQTSPSWFTRDGGYILTPTITIQGPAGGPGTRGGQRGDRGQQ